MSLPKPYYEELGISIFHGDCREILPHLEPVDLVLTDPPYGINFQSNHRIEKHSKIIGDEFLPLDLINQSMNKAKKASYFFCRWNNLNLMPPPQECFGVGEK